MTLPSSTGKGASAAGFVYPRVRQGQFPWLRNHLKKPPPFSPVEKKCCRQWERKRERNSLLNKIGGLTLKQARINGYFFLYLRYSSIKVIFKAIARIRGITSTHKFLYISMAKYWQAKTTAKAINVPNTPQPTAKQIRSVMKLSRPLISSYDSIISTIALR